MNSWTTLSRLLAATTLSLAAAAAPAAPVTLNLQGTVTGYEFIDLSAGLPVGAAVNLSLSFNDTFSDGTYDFGDDLGPVSGWMTVGSASFTFDGWQPYSYKGGIAGFPLEWVMPLFTGIGPTLNGGELYGLFGLFTPGLTLEGPLLLGYGFTTMSPDGFTITNFGYAKIEPSQYSITPGGPNPMPEPATLALALLGLLATRAVRR